MKRINAIKSNDKPKHSQIAMEAIGVYLNEVGINDIAELEIYEKKKLFIQVINDYRLYMLSLDELSYLCETLWWSIEDKENELAQIILMGAELTFYERTATDSSDSASSFIESLEEILNYAETESST